MRCVASFHRILRLFLLLWLKESDPQRNERSGRNSFLSLSSHSHISISPSSGRYNRVQRRVPTQRWGRSWQWEPCGRFRTLRALTNLKKGNWLPCCLGSPKQLRGMWLCWRRKTQFAPSFYHFPKECLTLADNLQALVGGFEAAGVRQWGRGWGCSCKDEGHMARIQSLIRTWLSAIASERMKKV